MSFNFNMQQTDVAELTTPRELTTSEAHHPNDFYGQAYVLKRYAELPENRPLYVVLEHGIRLDDTMWDVDRDSQFNTILSASRWRASEHNRLTTKTVKPIGFGYVYAAELVRRLHGADPKAGERQGTIAFPCHSTHSIKSSFDHADYARKLMALPAKFHPIYVCAYWKDYIDGSLQPYVDAGCQLVTAGHMFDQDFLLRFHGMCRQFRYAVSNRIGTHLFQSVHSGCRFFYLNSSEITQDIPESERNNCSMTNPHFVTVNDESWRLFEQDVETLTDELSAEQIGFVRAFMGDDLLLSPRELKSVLTWAKWRYRWKPRPIRQGSAWCNPLPPASLQFLGKFKRRIKKVGHSIAKRWPLGKTAIAVQDRSISDSTG